MGAVREQFDRWVNPATIRGVALVVAGLIILAVPGASTRVIGLVVAVALIVSGLTDLWTAVRTKPLDFKEILLAVVMFGAGVSLILYPGLALGFVARVLSVVLAVRGLMIAYQGLRDRGTESSWLYNLVRGLFYLAAGGILFFVPEAGLSTILVIAAVCAVVVGGIIISYGVSNPDEDNLSPNELGGLVKRWFQARDVGEDMRIDVVDNLFFEEPEATQKQIGFWTLLILSVVIATLGVLADSTAVVIGAMLVAPLMTPIMGVSAGIVNGWMARVTRSFATVAGGVTVAIATAWIVATWTPQLVPLASNSQILSRTSPTLIDLMIAMAAGAAGAYATVDKRVSSSITGVAIAVALVPPLGVVGIMLQAGEGADALGAFLLFLTNLVSIILVGSFVFFLAGLAPWAEIRANREKMKTVLLTVGLGALLIIVPLAFTSEGIIASAARQSETQRVTEEWLEDEPRLRVVRVEIDGSAVEVLISGEGTVPSVAELEASLEEALNTEVVVLVEYFPSEIVSSGLQDVADP
ncbi:MAG: DUF389 domain-containing protein, partial [Acidimicrobiia bacterium]